ncbi:TatD family hydrolase [Carboxylicivirga sp. RSCT41]|uniref:TatD family hydrolase n=1 Tax=Carboxylicivirga agarovorans TaxID=3417570 RepID=UPI003D334A5F
MYINLHTHNYRENDHCISIENIDASGIQEHFNPSHLVSAGIHPWHIDDSYKAQLEKIKELTRDKNTIAIGECGLDKLRGPKLSIQQEVFLAQIDLSEEQGLPLIIHCVKAYTEIIKLRKDVQPSQAWIFHGFNASKETMEQALKYDFHFSFGQSLFNPGSKASTILPFIPNNRLFLETDDNPQLKIQSVYEKASEITNIDINDLLLIINRNFKRLFNVNT